MLEQIVLPVLAGREQAVGITAGTQRQRFDEFLFYTQTRERVYCIRTDYDH